MKKSFFTLLWFFIFIFNYSSEAKETSVKEKSTQTANAMLRIACSGDDMGAEIYLNGKFKGECPVDVQVPEGSYKLRVFKSLSKQYELSFEQDIRLAEGNVKKIEAVLEKKFTLEWQKNLDRKQQESESEKKRQEQLAEAEKKRQEQLKLAEEEKVNEKLKNLMLKAQAGDDNAMVALAEWSGSQGSLGIGFKKIDSEDARKLGLLEPMGVYVLDVSKGSEADKAGLMQGDILLEFDGVKILDITTYNHLTIVARPGSTKMIDFLRNNERKTTSIKVVENLNIAYKKSLSDYWYYKAAQKGNKLAMIMSSELDENRKKIAIKVYKVPEGAVRDVGIEGEAAVLEFVKNDSFFNFGGDGRTFNYTIKRFADIDSNASCKKNGNLFELIYRNDTFPFNITMNGITALGGLLSLKGNGGGFYDPNEYVWSVISIDKLYGNPFHLAQGNRFSLSFKFKQKNSIESHYLSCLPTVKSNGVIFVSCVNEVYKDKRFFYTAFEIDWDASSGCFKK